MYSFPWQTTTPDHSTTSFTSPYSDPNFYRSAERVDWLKTRKNPRVITYEDTPPSQVLKRRRGIDMDVGFMTTPDGWPLRYARFAPSNGKISKNILDGEGKSQCVEVFHFILDHVVRQGVQFWILDKRYQGFSPRLESGIQKVHARDFLIEHCGDEQQFYYEVVKPNSQKLPVEVASFSMGAAVSYMSFIEGLIPQDEISHFYAISPLVKAEIGFKHWAAKYSGFNHMFEWAALSAAEILERAGFEEAYFQRNPFKNGDRDWEYEIRYNQTEYTFDRDRLEFFAKQSEKEKRVDTGAGTVGLVCAYNKLRKWQRNVEANSISVPSTVFIPWSDEVVNPTHSYRFLQKVLIDPRMIFLEEAHALEMSCQETIEFIGDILLGRTPPSNTPELQLNFEQRSFWERMTAPLRRQERSSPEREGVSLQAGQLSL